MQSVGFERKMCRACFHVFEEFAVVARTVGAEILKDGRERCVWHGNLEEVVAERDLLYVSGRKLG